MRRRAAMHTAALLELIARFPRANPAEEADMDIPRLLRLIRSRYRALCAALGVRPRLHAAEDVVNSGGGDGDAGAEAGGIVRAGKASVWDARPAGPASRPPPAPDFSF
jgi:hypothetical protein